MISVVAGCSSLAGRRFANEDSAGACEGIACVCDGVARSEFGGMAAAIARNYMLKNHQTGLSPQELVMGAHKAIGEFRELLRGPEEEEAPTAQTTALLVAWEQLLPFPETYVARFSSVGDCMAYLLRSGKLVRIDEPGRLESSSNRLEAALGSDCSVKEFVHECELEIVLGDRLLLCTDGVWDQDGADAAIESLMLAARNPLAASRGIVDWALEESTDNCTAVCLFFQSAETDCRHEL